MLVDTHCHLDFPEFDLDRTEVIKRALGSDVRYIINVGSSLEGTKRSIELANKYEPIYTSVGIHPHDTHQLDTQVFEDLRGLAKFKKVVAIGEVGLDYCRPFPPKEVQIDALLKFIRLSLDFSLPLIVHIRSAHKDALQIFKQEMKSMCGVLHCFSGDEDFLKSCLELGLHISFTCNITFKKSDNLRRLARLVPLNRLLLETDAPFLAPQDMRGERNEPSFLRFLVDKLSELKGLSFDEVAKVTTQNAINLFNLPR
jgi:TatD DNase family protein